MSNENIYFLACEFKPKSPFWSVIEPFAYDIKPAYINGSLGIINYNKSFPDSYAIVDVIDKGVSDPLLGYIFTCSNIDTQILLDKIKCYYGVNSVNFHNKKQIKAYIDSTGNEYVNAWFYSLSNLIVDQFSIIEQVLYGIWDKKDEELLLFLESMGKNLEEDDMEGDIGDGEEDEQ